LIESDPFDALATLARAIPRPRYGVSPAAPTEGVPHPPNHF